MKKILVNGTDWCFNWFVILIDLKIADSDSTSIQFWYIDFFGCKPQWVWYCYTWLTLLSIPIKNGFANSSKLQGHGDKKQFF